MTLDQLLTLHAIVSEGTFRGAAQRLHKSQSALSHSIKKLEQEIGLEVLSRDDYRPSLTAHGKVFYRQATRIILQMQHLKQLTQNLNAEQEPEVNIVITATQPLDPVLHVINQATREFPATHIRLAVETMGGPAERLLKNSADIIIAALDGIPSDQVEAIPFSVTNIIPVASPDYGEQQWSERQSITAMQAYVQVVVASSSSHDFEQSRDLLPGGLRWTVSDFATKKEIIQAAMGWGGLPEHMISSELASGELIKLDVEGYPVRRSELYQIRHRDRLPGKVAQTLWDRLAQVN